MIAEVATWQQEQQQQERRRAARQKTLEAIWDDVAKRHREDLSALYQASPAPASAPVAASPPEPEPRAAAEASRRFVVPNVIEGQAPVVRKPWPTFADVLRTYLARPRLLLLDLTSCTFRSIPTDIIEQLECRSKPGRLSRPLCRSRLFTIFPR